MTRGGTVPQRGAACGLPLGPATLLAAWAGHTGRRLFGAGARFVMCHLADAADPLSRRRPDA